MMEKAVEESWLKITKNLDQSLKQKWWNIIKDYYSQDWRRYHTLQHIHDMILHVNECSARTQNSETENLLLFATFFHDIIYNPQSRTNEEDSADKFLEFCKETNIFKEKTDDIRKIQNWIILTKSHQTSAHMSPNCYGEDPSHYLLDCDMAILGQNADKYRYYAYDIRQEYIHIPDGDFHKARLKVLSDFLHVPNIYATKYFRDKLENKARINIQTEIASLEIFITSLESS